MGAPPENPFINLPESVILDQCPDCREPTYYDRVLTSQVRFHTSTGEFLCPEPRGKS